MFYDFLISEAKFDVYFIDSDFINPATKIKLKTIAISNLLEEFLVKATTIGRQIALTDKLTDRQYKMAQLEMQYKARIDLQKEFNEKRISQYKELAPLTFQFVRLIQSDVINM